MLLPKNTRFTVGIPQHTVKTSKLFMVQVGVMKVGFVKMFQLIQVRFFWLQTVNDVSVTVPGAVIAANQNTTTTIGGKMDIFTGVFPVGLNIQDISLSGNADLYGSDKLMVFNAETQKYSIYSWYSTTYSEDFLTSYGSGWGNESWVRQDITLDIGQGFWLQTVGDCNVTFQAPEGL